MAIEVFEGNTADPQTLNVQIEKLRKRFGVQRVVLVGDRGMLTSRRIDEELRDVEGLDWISALRADNLQKLAAAGLLQPSLFDQRDLAEVTWPDFPGERLVVCRNPLLADERARKRRELLQATEKDLAKVAAAVTRAQRPLRGTAQIGLRVGKVLNDHKVGKHFQLEIDEACFVYRRNEAQIAEEAALARPVRDSHVGQERCPLGRRHGARLQRPGKSGACLSLHENRGPAGAADLSPAGRTHQGARVLVHAGVLRRVAHASAAGADPVRRPPASGGGSESGEHRLTGAAFDVSPAERLDQTHGCERTRA